MVKLQIPTDGVITLELLADKAPGNCRETFQAVRARERPLRQHHLPTASFQLQWFRAVVLSRA